MYDLEIEDDTGTMLARAGSAASRARSRLYSPARPDPLYGGEVRESRRHKIKMIRTDLEIGDTWDDDTENFRARHTGLHGHRRRLGPPFPTHCPTRGRIVGRQHSGLPARAFPQGARSGRSPDRAFGPCVFGLRTLTSQRSSASRLRHNGGSSSMNCSSCSSDSRSRSGASNWSAASHASDEDIARALQRLPFQLTGAQSRALQEVARDIAKPTPMNRLLQGDVGSGKTAVALACALVAVENGYQAAVMAPTELLAEQHLRTFQRLLGEDLFERKPGLPPIRTGLLSAGRKPKDLLRTKNEIASGTVRIAVGTHSLAIQEGVAFHKLGGRHH